MIPVLFLCGCLFIICESAYFTVETCKLPPLKGTPLCNTSLPIETRVSDLLQVLTIAEKIQLTSSNNQEIKRLNISYMGWGQEALHGIVQTGGHVATSYPQVINLGRSFDIDNIHKMATKISDEGRALSNLGLIHPSFWSPNLNVYRDPRWGRGQETPGEDPVLIEKYAEVFITGMQEGKDPRYLKVLSCPKHYTAYDLEFWPFNEFGPPLKGGTDRHHFDAIVTAQDMAETFQPPFEAGVSKGKPGCIMCSYPEINGIPACAHSHYQNEVLRGQWGFDGHIVSDCGAVEDIYANHHYVTSEPKAVQAALLGGDDLNCGSYYVKYMQDALDQKLITEKDLDVAVGRIIKNRIRLGEFDPWEDQPYKKLGEEVINTKENQELALLLAKESIVLLKNENDVLPLDKNKYRKLAVIGPSADDKLNLQGIYSTQYPPYLVTPKAGIEKYVEVLYSPGCGFILPVTTFEESIAQAKEADATVLVVGNCHDIEAEARDRNHLYWYGEQSHLIRNIRYSIPSKPVIVVVVGGGPIDVSWEKENVDAIIFLGYPSQSGGDALAQVLFGDYNPSGKLTTTVYPEKYADQCNMTDMNMRPSTECPAGRTYKFYNGDPVYKFGDGLSYTTFEYSWVESDVIYMSLEKLRKEEKENVATTVNLKVKNTGKYYEGDEVVLGFVRNTFIDDAPLKQLFDFKRISLKIGQVKNVQLQLNVKDLHYVDKQGKRNLLPGEYHVMVGDLKKKIVVN